MMYEMIKDTLASSFAAVTAGAVLAMAAVVPGTVPPGHGLALPVDLSAVITPGSATNWDAQGIDEFYGIDWNAQYGPTVVATFHLLRDWIQIDAINQAVKTNPRPNVVLSSGRGAGNASALISSYVCQGDPALYSTDWVLDNNIDRPNGGYASRLPFFSLVVVNPVPTPTDTGAPILDVGYEYAWNSDVPLYVTNVVALLNSITEYGYRYAKQDVTTLPAEVLDPDGSVNYGAAPGHYIVDTNGDTTFQPLSDTNTTIYVSYRSKGLALLRPLRDFGGKPGQIVADLIEPPLKVVIDAGYPDNTPLSPPDVYTPMRLFAPPKVVLTAARQLPGAIKEGIAAAKADLLSGKPEPAAATTPKPAKAVPQAKPTRTGKSARTARAAS